MRIQRLGYGDREQAQQLFLLMTDVLGEKYKKLGDTYLNRLLQRKEFWAIAAFDNDEMVGGLTAHELPMTASESAELFIYDMAVKRNHQRLGVGRLLLADVRERARTAEISEVFVLADNMDVHALDFYRATGAIPSEVTLFAIGNDSKTTKKGERTV